MKKKILDKIIENEKKNYHTLRLIASENLPLLNTRLPFILDMYARYAFSGENDESTGYFPQYNLREIENETKQMLGEMLNARYVNVRPISGMNCMLTAVASVTQPGDLVLSFSPADGGHGETNHIFKSLNLKHEYLPFDRKRWSIDYKKIEALSFLSHVKVIYLDLCMALFPQDIALLREKMPRGVKIIYDASHVMGLICGKQFQNPLLEGVDLLVGSTHKTFPGPHKGIIACNKLTYSIKVDAISYHYTSHHHIADVACLGLVAENGPKYFENYAKQTTYNAQYIARKLYGRGIKVEFPDYGFTQSHQIWIDCGPLDQLNEIVKTLYSLDIIVNAIKIPTLDGRWGIRLGLQEVSNLNISERGLDQLALILAEVIQGNRDITYLMKIKLDITENHIENFYKEKQKAQELLNFFKPEVYNANCVG